MEIGKREKRKGPRKEKGRGGINLYVGHFQW